MAIVYSMNAGGELQKILEALAVVDGFFVLTGSDDKEYVVGRREMLDRPPNDNQQQLELFGEKETREISDDDEDWASINDIMADSSSGVANGFIDRLDDLAIPREIKKVSFEPIKGDLSPDLQE